MAASDGLSDADWAIWEPFFPPERGRVGQPAKVSTRLFLDALLWMTGEGARWRALPERFDPWKTIWRRFARLPRSGRVRGRLRHGRGRRGTGAHANARRHRDQGASARGR